MRDSLAEHTDSLARRFYQDKAVVARYDEARFGSPGGKVLDALERDAIRRTIWRENLQGVRALDVGCGTGRFTRLLLELGATVTAVDTSQGMLAEVRRRSPSARAVLTDARRLPFESGAFDLGISIWVYNHMASYEEAISELCRVSQEGIILGLPNMHSLHVVPYVLRRLHLWNGTFSAGSQRGLTPPTSIYFTLEQTRKVLLREGFAITNVVTCLLLPLVPNPIARLYPRLEEALRRVLRLNGCFMAVAAMRVGDPHCWACQPPNAL
jgi:ubiquinone/menaquinone biosynthesis C-methylase UbiE